jgi:hypothetical protein
MKAITKFLAGGVAIAALASAAPAAAQYYPGYGSPYGGNVIGQVLSSVLGGGYGYNGYGYNGYGNGGYAVNSQAAVNQCANAVQARLGGGYGGYGYRAYGGGAGRVLGISRVEPRSNGGLTVRGVASSGAYAGYAYGAQAPVDLTWRCKTDYRGFVTDVSVNRAQSNYGYNSGAVPYGNYGAAPYGASPYGNYDYSQYGYSRY